MGRARNAALWELWRRRLREFEQAETTVDDFCTRLGVSAATFYQWRRKLRHATSAPLHFLPVEISGSAQVEVLLPGGARVSIPSRDHEALRTVLTALLAERGDRQPC